MSLLGPCGAIARPVCFWFGGIDSRGGGKVENLLLAFPRFHCPGISTALSDAGVSYGSESGADSGFTAAGQNLAFVTSAEHQSAGNGRAPFSHVPLKCPQLPRGECPRHLGLEPLEECLGSRLRLLVEPLPNLRPNILEWIDPCSP